jgi:hypothetical protein
VALLFVESFDTVDTSTLSGRWTLNGSGHTVAAARTGNGLSKVQGAVDGSFQRLITIPTSNITEAIVGFAFRTTSITNTFGASDLVSFLDSTTRQISLSLQSTTGLLFLWNGSLQAIASDHALAANTWYYIELKVAFGNSAAASVRVNGEAVTGLTAVTIDSQNTANSYANNIRFNNITISTGSMTVLFDDIYVGSTSGSAPRNDFLGDCRVEVIRPTAEGNYSEFDPSSGSDNALMVDDAAPDGDSTYVATNVLNEIDTYITGDLATTTGTVYGVQTSLYARKDEAQASPRSISPVIRRGGSDSVGGGHDLNDTYAQHRQMFEQDPIASADWTIPSVNASEFGQKVTT